MKPLTGEQTTGDQPAAGKMSAGNLPAATSEESPKAAQGAGTPPHDPGPSAPPSGTSGNQPPDTPRITGRVGGYGSRAGEQPPSQQVSSPAASPNRAPAAPSTPQSPNTTVGQAAADQPAGLPPAGDTAHRAEDSELDPADHYGPANPRDRRQTKKPRLRNILNFRKDSRIDPRIYGKPGAEAQEILDRWHVIIRYEPGGTHYRRGLNTIFVDPDDSTDIQLLKIHEATHVKYHRERRSANPYLLGRDEFVKRSLMEEAEAQANQIRANIELQAVKPTAPDIPLQREYMVGYWAGVENAETLADGRGQTLTAAERQAAGEQEALSAVYFTIANSEDFVTATTKETYPEFWGNYWDEVHREIGDIP